MAVRDEIAELRREVHGAKTNEVRHATKNERHVCARQAAERYLAIDFAYRCVAPALARSSAI